MFSPELTSLFLGSLLASTVVPGGVEVLLYYLFKTGEHPFYTLLLVATVGNTLGGIITFAMGWLLQKGLSGIGWQQRIDRLFKLSDQAVSRVRKWGIPVLFFSWMPIIGDPLCLAGGYLRLSFWPSAATILLGKFIRYLVLLWLFTTPWSGIAE